MCNMYVQEQSKSLSLAESLLHEYKWVANEERSESQKRSLKQIKQIKVYKSKQSICIAETDTHYIQ